MPNNTRTQPDGTWVDGYTPPETDWVDLERKIFESWNGDRGGAFAPPPGNYASTPYVFNGSGLQVTGPTRLTSGGSISGGASAFQILDGTWPETGPTHVARARKIVQSLDAFIAPDFSLWSRNHPYAGIGSVALSVRGTNSRIIRRPEFYIPLRVVDGATLLQITLTFRVAIRRTLAPVAMPKIRIMRIPKDSFSNAAQPLKATVDGLGFDSPPLVTSPDDWFQNGNAQTFTYVCDQNNVIDVSNYSYVVHVQEETGATDPDAKFDGIRFCEQKSDVFGIVQNPGLLSGDSFATGDAYADVVASNDQKRMLVVDTEQVLVTGTTGGNSSRNGIWLAKAALDWVRADDCANANDFTPNFLIYVTDGQWNQGTMWQCQYPSSASPISLSGITASAAKTQIRIIPAEPRGNIYHTITSVHDVVDLRFQ